MLSNRRSTHIARKRLSDSALCGRLEAAGAPDSSNGLHAQTTNHLIRAYIASSSENPPAASTKKGGGAMRAPAFCICFPLSRYRHSAMITSPGFGASMPGPFGSM